MTSIVNFTALTGSLSDKPLCYLLRVDDALFLLDCGWDDRFLPEDLELLAAYARQVNVLLLSHPDLTHLGAYPYAQASLGLDAAVYATLPTQNMGRMCLQDAVLRRMEGEDFTLMTPASVNDAFDRIQPLRYSQPTSLLGKCLGISITAYAAGHTIGGTIWKIQKESDEIVYAVDINHRRELHLNGTALHSNGTILDALHRPSLLITSTHSSLSSTAPRKDRHASLHSTLSETLLSGGNVLLPIDASSRVLELLYLLEQHWSLHRLSYPIFFLSKTAYRTIHYAKSMLEWMGDGITEQFATTRENPFDLRHIRLCHRVEEVEAVQGPKVVLATGSSLLSGPSRVLLSQWAPHPENVLLLTQRSFPSSMANQLLSLWEEASGVSAQQGLGERGMMGAESKAPQNSLLSKEGDEGIVPSRKRERPKESDSNPNDPSSHVLHQQFDVYVRDLYQGGRKRVFLGDALLRMFPFQERRRRFNEYGEAIHAEDYMKASDLQAASSLAKASFGPSDPLMDSVSPSSSKKAQSEPVKYITLDEGPITWQCKVQYIDMEGLSDGRSLHMILPQVNPRKVLFVAGNRKETNAMSETCLALSAFTRDVQIPHEGLALNVSSSTNIYRLRLGDQLNKDNEVMEEAKRPVPILHAFTDVQHAPHSPSPPVPQLPGMSLKEKSTLVGEVRLPELRRLIQASGLQADFRGEGVLVCTPGGVTIRKTATGKVAIQGPLSEVYFKVRKLLYSQFAIV
ncbi:beta-lactamase-like protein [Piptocephalis cylindrospora]|uniref:Cleavage and polyadenylation specificity factor subunit 2 n=1 Tax=Piptocephalis cylindrospora TaxID=1907219 RepID=A0A4P9Y262_9FUNG|nr:beta-lactamase-like protein [Piptocephalis cylindrospora]|eukprot:RKP12642.1 beta-lactamase-like protein [Piptocephalis cylindrospora]